MDDIKQQRIAFANTLLFETPGGLRFTQDSPILPNVWLAFAAEPHKQHELILTTTQSGGTGHAAYELRKMLKVLRKKRTTLYPDKRPDGTINERAKPRVSYIPGQIAVKIYFDELMRVVLPLTPWWHEIYDTLHKLQRDEKLDKANVANWIPFPEPDKGKDKNRNTDITEALMIMRDDIDPGFDKILDPNSDFEKDDQPAKEIRLSYIRAIPPDFTWLVRIAGLISYSFHKGENLLEKDSLSEQLYHEFEWRRKIRENPDLITTTPSQQDEFNHNRVSDETAFKTRIGIVESFTQLYENWSDGQYPNDRLVWRITKNRPIRLAVNKSSLTVKADAAIRLFDISCQNITWAVLDSGIDPDHPAFKVLSPKYEQQIRKDIEKGKLPDEDRGKGELLLRDLKKSRITKTLDFTRLRELLDFDVDVDDSDANNSTTQNSDVKKEIARRLNRDDETAGLTEATDLLEELQRRILDGKDINWQDLEKAIVDNNPKVPKNDHGTHVAGILGADWIEEYESENQMPLSQRSRRLHGVCPDINLIDVRVFREDGLTDEFELLAAVQYLRWMNSRAGTMAVHGANLSLSLIHEVRRFACGQTPICEECNESTALGMVMVVAAGNRGFNMENTEKVRSTDSYQSVSITDPGNAQGVITVGATHRKRPHEYGVSYFSSRGPTGDGRLKPDIVAPGEKIKGPTPNGRAEFKDGTSMAAPHVSGVAALLMARHSELIGQPERLKKILCETATDLGRERYFQGHGLVDALRALQSV